MRVKKVIIMGAAGRDFHNFNVLFRDNNEFEVVAFTATQIPGIDNRIYPPELSGELYPEGIPIYSENKLESLICEYSVDECIFSYSDISYKRVMAIGARVNASGADFRILGPKNTMIKSRKPVIAVGAVRTGCGKSQSSRKIIEILMDKGFKVIAIRHPMPYGDLSHQRVQRFAELDDLVKHHCTVEEMEEYEPHINRGNVIYAGIDYQAILESAENDPSGCDVIVWDGGNNDTPFYVPDLMVTLVDPHRPGHELNYFPGEITLRMADVVLVNKIDSSDLEGIEVVRRNIREVNPLAVVVDSASPIRVEDPSLIRGKRVLVIEDGPTLTHGEMKFGAGIIAAKKFEAAEIIDPRPFLSGDLIETFKMYPEIGALLPAMGYDKKQLFHLEKTVNNTNCDSVIIATPIDLRRIINIVKPSTRVTYDIREIGKPDLVEVLDRFIINKMKKR